MFCRPSVYLTIFSLMTPLITLCRDARADSRLQVQVMSFNIRTSRGWDGANHWDHRKVRVAEVIRRFQGDFVGLQEVQPDQAVYLRLALPEYGYLGRTREADPHEGEAVPLLYRNDRWELDPAEHGVFWLSKTPEVPGSKSWWSVCPRIVTWGRFIERETGQAVYVYNSHFSHISEPARRNSAALLATRIAGRPRGEPVVLLGDLNAGEASYAVSYLKGGFPNAPVRLVDTYREVHPEASGVGTFNGFRGSNGGAKIDYVLTDRTAQVIDARILRSHDDGRYPSDHFPVTATIRFPLRTPVP